ncbi:MAG: methyltransferase [Propionibacteriaceae bacterium]|jgi:16S rRNA G1207 methylase RsmC|nr:methyltransferase [Propionibacteriaceae bacterium]
MRHNDPVTHYFETPTTPAEEFTIPVTLWGKAVELTSSPGVFSGHRLDPGTAVLLRTVAPPDGATPDTTLLDLGCGLGPIALALALHTPATIYAVDVNARAVALTAKNAQRLGVADRVHALAPDQVDPALCFDEIWSNPPIRIGKPALHSLLATWLTRLSPPGRAYLVTAKNLGADSLAAWLNTEGFPTEKLASAKGYRVLRVGPLSATAPHAAD